jgi:hypothetical protein
VCIKVKVKCTLVHALTLCTGRTARPIGGVEVLLYSFMTTALEGGEGSASCLGRSLPPGNTRYPLYRRLGGSQGRSGQVRKISPPPGFDIRPVQPVASRHTDYATRPIRVYTYIEKRWRGLIRQNVVICKQ